MPDKFILRSDFAPTGDQPEAIEALVDGVKNGDRDQTLIGVTGSGKTFTMANVIAKLNRPAIILEPNKTPAAQTCSEMREFFPENAVEFFVSYYDYYQPEAYVPGKDIYIEKDSSVNNEIDKLRHSATSALFERRDVIIVASVSCIYSLGDPSEYAEQVLSVDYSTTLLIATAAAIVSYLPVGFIASRIGRKKTVIAGVVMLAVAFAAAAFMQKGTHVMVMNGLFVLAGVGWATINVNSYPMVVELAKGSTVGKFTGYYYTASMAAQAATPFLSGLLMDGFGMWTLFPYAAVFVALALVTMAFVRHGDSKPEQKKSMLEHLDVDD
jgi:hypothetical protein